VKGPALLEYERKANDSRRRSVGVRKRAAKITATAGDSKGNAIFMAFHGLTF